jgi:hypothetical protein
MIVLSKAKRAMALDLRNTSPTQRVQCADVSHHALHRVGPRAALCARMSEADAQLRQARMASSGRYSPT